MRKIICMLVGIFCCSTSFAKDALFTFEFSEVAAGVWVGVRPDSSRFPVMGNTMFVLSDEGVVVFDGGGVPAMADQIIEKVRSLTDKPVTHVVTSHWHGDHNFGIYRFAEEFANVQFIAHHFTADVMQSPRIAYIDRSPGFIDRNREIYTAIIETGKDADGNDVPEYDRLAYQYILEDEELLMREFDRFRVTPPNVLMGDSYTIESGKRTIELLHLGHANTAGDIVMWLPEEKIVATGDIVVLPSPYAFNVPPRPWAETLRNIKKLDYKMLVPGHGPIQTNSEYVDLLIEASVSIADQRDAMLADGKETEEVEAALDFSAFEQRFTGGDPYKTHYYDAWFEGPFRAAAMKALTGEPMVAIERAGILPFDNENWEFKATTHELQEHLGQAAVKLQGGSIIIPETDVLNGVAEFDIAATGERGFAGLIFRQTDDDNYEHFYIRPHQSGNVDANQYTPVFNGVSGWQLYHGDGYGAPVEYRKNEWMHVKVVFAGSRADVYIDSDRPVLRINDLKREPKAGKLGVNAAAFAPAWFANFKFTTLPDAYELPGPGPDDTVAPENRIAQWQVSDAFDTGLLDGVLSLDEDAQNARTWTALDTESSGIANLARTTTAAAGPNTKFARLVLHSDRDQTRLISLGYSDSARVFVNGELQYQGDNTYMSRDYRYLGTIGLFDSVALPLKKGENEVWIAVTEAFGGWGVMAELDNTDGIRILASP